MTITIPQTEELAWLIVGPYSEVNLNSKELKRGKLRFLCLKYSLEKQTRNKQTKKKYSLGVMKMFLNIKNSTQ